MATFAQIREASAEANSQVLVGTVTATSPLTVDFGNVSETTDTVVVKTAGYEPVVDDEVVCQQVGNFYVVLDKLGSANAAAAWTPTVDNGITVGNGDWSGSQLSLANGWCDFYLQFELGSTSSIGTDVRIDWPYTPAGSSRTANTFRGVLEDADGVDYAASGYRFDSSAFRIVALGTAGNDVDIDILDSSTPHTWATGDLITLTGRYPVDV